MNKLVEGLTNEQVSVRAKTVSAEYIRKIRKYGQLPSEDIARKIVSGFTDKPDEAQGFLIACGFEQPKDPVIRVRIALRANGDYDDELVQEIEEIVAERLEAFKRRKEAEGRVR
jgi:hypothetical protein